MAYNKLTSLAANIKAIRTAHRLHQQRRTATAAERAELALYSGFGGIKEVLDIGTPHADSGSFAEPLRQLQSVIADIADGDETIYKSLIDSVKASVLTAFYTPQFIIAAVAKQIQTTFADNSLPIRSFLEPSAGIGGFLPVGDAATHRYAIEKDVLTAMVLAALHPETDTHNTGFENIAALDLPDTTFDVIASNIPFGNFRVFDADFWKKGGIYEQSTKAIHNYFFIKALELLNEGGLLAFVTTRGIADTPGNKFVRDHLTHHANLITALRLPDNLFALSSGIEVGSDLLIWQKQSQKQGLSSREQLFLQTIREQAAPGLLAEPSNKMFTLPKTTLATESRIAANQFGKQVRKYLWHGTEEALLQAVASILRADFDRHFRKSLIANPGQTEPVQMSLFDCFDIDVETVAPTAAKPNLTTRPYAATVQSWLKDGALATLDGQVGTLRYRKSGLYADTAVDFVPMAISDADTAKVLDYLPLRDTYFELSTKEREEREEQPTLRERLNALYDQFTAKWGSFHDRTNKELILQDALGMEVLTIEMQQDGKSQKADIMREPVAFKRTANAAILAPDEALATSLNFFGKVDMAYIAQATAKSEEEIITALRGAIFYDPTTATWEHRGRFLAGNVIAKAKEIRSKLPLLSGMAKEQAEISAAALEDIAPDPIPFEELELNLGERWIDPQLYAAFATDLFAVPTEVSYFDVNDTYVVNLRGYSPVAYNTYSIHGYNGGELFVHALQDTVPEITKEIWRDGERVRIPDEEAMQEAATKIEEIRSKFGEWLDRQPIALRDEITAAYNERFNCYVRPTYDDSMQTFPGLSFEQFNFKSLYPSQKDAIWMIKEQSGGVCWHEVGTGKTLIMCVAAYEMKRLGLANKPMIIGLKANVHEIADTFRKAYPSARLLYPGKEDFTPAKRREIFSAIQNGNWDCIILTHDQFSKIPQSEETQAEIFAEELADVERSLQVLEDSGMGWRNRRMQSGLQKRMENLKAKLSELHSSIKSRKDDTLDFRTMGIDHLFIDEAHQFKNAMIQTRHNRVAGIGNVRGSQRAMNLLFAIRDIQRRTGRDLGATFLSGTVIVNALTELYVVFKYLRPKELRRQRITCFDAWAAIFTKKTADYELNVTGSIKRKERFRTYIKVPELAAFLREITDYRTAEMIQLDVPDRNVRFLSHKPTAEQEEMIGRLVSFANSGEWGDLGLDLPKPENLDKAKMLVATNVARKMSLDMRLLGSQFHDDPDNKASICARTVYDYYQRFNEQRGTQLIFSDLSTYKPGEWNIYSDIKEKLMALGIPSDEIQFIQSAKTEKARKQLFADTNSGKVRVLFGSTTMLGTGVNVQQRAVAVHHLEIPWRPADMEQRNGRAVRKGNSVKLWGGNVVDIVVYGTEKTLDAYKFNLLRNKQLFISQINNGTIGVRRIDEGGLDEDTGMNFAEFVAVLSGNTDLLEKAKLDNRIMQLEKEQTLFRKECSRAERQIAANTADIAKCKATIERMECDVAYFADYEGERITVLNTLSATATAKDVGQELHIIAKRNRCADFTVIGSYIGLRLLVRSDCNLDGTFDRNSFYVESVSGLKYRCGLSGALPQGFADSALYPQTTLAAVPTLIARQREQSARLESELPTLQDIAARRWPKSAELARLKSDSKALQQRIDAALKAAEQPAEPSAHTKPQAASNPAA